MPPRLATQVHVDLCVLVDPHDEAETWSPVQHVPPAEAAALWGGAARVSCCTVQVGFRLTLDGVVWNAEAMDELGMAETWAPCLLALLGGASRAAPWPWEESGVRLSRRGEQLDALDVHHSGQVVCPWVRLPLRALAVALAEAVETGGTWLDAVAAEASQAVTEVLVEQRNRDWGADAAALRAAAAAPIPAPPEGDPGPIPVPWLAALCRDLAGLRAGSPDLREESKTLLHLAVQVRWTEGVEVLLARGARVELRDQQGFTALQQAARRAQGRPGPHPIVAALLAYGASLDPISAVLLDDPVGLRVATDRGDICRGTLNWWAMDWSRREGPVPEPWQAALRHAVAAGTPPGGRKRGLGGWYETPIEAAERGGNPHVLAFLRSLAG